MKEKQPQGLVLAGTRKVWVFMLLGAILLLAGSVFGIDWTNYLFQIKSPYPAIAKPGITLLSMIILLMAGKYALEKKDWVLLVLAFCCMLPTDILMSVVAAVPGMTVGGLTFMVGGVLSIIAHIFLIIRVGRGFGYFKIFRLSEIWLPVLVYGSAVVVIFILWNDMVRVGHAVIGPAYTAFFCTTTWLAWETVRRKLYPAPNAWMVAIAATCWYITEIIGEVYNVALGDISQVMFCLVWVFYGTNVVLWALSGYRWK